MKYRIFGIILLAILILSVYHSLFQNNDTQEVYVVLRYDDYSNPSSLMVENELLTAIDNYGFSCSFGIIPYVHKESDLEEIRYTPLDSSKIKLIGNAVRDGSVEVSLHGYSHTDEGSAKVKSEFMGRTESWQRDRLSTAKEFLEEAFAVKVQTFIPPWNTYDPVTHSLLSELGFKHISADHNGYSNQVEELSYYPETVSMPSLEKLTESKSMPYHNRRAVLILMMHDYDFLEIDSLRGVTNINDFRRLTEKIAGLGWNVVSIEKAEAALGIFNERNYRYNKLAQLTLGHLSPLKKIPLLFTRLTDLYGFYLSGSQVIRMILLVIIYYLLMLMVVVEIVMLSLRIIPLNKRIIKLAGIVLGLLFALGLIYFWSDDHSLGKNEMLVLVMLLSSSIAMLFKLSRTPVIGN